MSAAFAVGTDLGTTNRVLAAVPPAGAGETAPGVAEVLLVPQVVAPGRVETRPALPSFLLLDTPGKAVGAHDLPWAAGRDYAVGEGARRRGAEVPGRVVAAAKSWLAVPGVDRRQPILPEALARWLPERPPRVLAGNVDLDAAVARGAAR